MEPEIRPDCEIRTIIGDDLRGASYLMAICVTHERARPVGPAGTLDQAVSRYGLDDEQHARHVLNCTELTAAEEEWVERYKPRR